MQLRPSRSEQRYRLTAYSRPPALSPNHRQCQPLRCRMNHPHPSRRHSPKSTGPPLQFVGRRVRARDAAHSRVDERLCSACVHAPAGKMPPFPPIHLSMKRTAPLRSARDRYSRLRCAGRTVSDVQSPIVGSRVDYEYRGQRIPTLTQAPARRLCARARIGGSCGTIGP